MSETTQARAEIWKRGKEKKKGVKSSVSASHFRPRILFLGILKKAPVSVPGDQILYLESQDKKRREIIP